MVTDPRLIDAAGWAERLEGDPSAATRARFAAWHAQPGHGEAWAAVTAAHKAVTDVADHSDLLALRHAAVARVALARPPARLAPWAWAAAACAVAAAPLAWWQYPARAPAVQVAAAPVYRTAVGQRLMVTLSDGSRLTLDTASRVRVAYTATERRLVLEEGQALFEVAKHQSRPFVVAAGGRSVTAHGTSFDVRLHPGAVQVALVEGKVIVAGGGAAPVALAPDDVLTASELGVSVRHVPGLPQRLASWSEGRLVFDDDTLQQAVAEMNRYATPGIAIADAAAARIRISGSFRTGDVQPFLDALQIGFPVTVRRDRDGRTIIGSRP